MPASLIIGHQLLHFGLPQCVKRGRRLLLASLFLGAFYIGMLWLRGGS
jgi:hypothetical protein